MLKSVYNYFLLDVPLRRNRLFYSHFSLAWQGTQSSGALGRNGEVAYSGFFVYPSPFSHSNPRVLHVCVWSGSCSWYTSYVMWAQQIMIIHSGLSFPSAVGKLFFSGRTHHDFNLL